MKVIPVRTEKVVSFCKAVTFFLSFACYSHLVQAQQIKATRPLKDRIYIGGNAGMQFGDVLLIDISPMVGYRVTDRFSTGVGVRYMYVDQRRMTYYEPDHIYGGSLFARMDVYQGLFAYSEFEVLNRRIELDRRINIGSWFVGGGYSQPLGDRAGMSVMLLYNLTESEYSIYGNNPIIRVGFGVGL